MATSTASLRGFRIRTSTVSPTSLLHRPIQIFLHLSQATKQHLFPFSPLQIPKSKPPQIYFFYQFISQ